jgi:hypothetical protein
MDEELRVRIVVGGVGDRIERKLWQRCYRHFVSSERIEG